MAVTALKASMQPMLTQSMMPSRAAALSANDSFPVPAPLPRRGKPSAALAENVQSRNQG